MRVAKIETMDDITIVRMVDETGVIPDGLSVIFNSTGSSSWEIIYGHPVKSELRGKDDTSIKTSFGYYIMDFMKQEIGGNWNQLPPFTWRIGDELELCVCLGYHLIMMNGRMIRRSGAELSVYEAIQVLTSNIYNLPYMYRTSPHTYNIEIEPWFLR